MSNRKKVLGAAFIAIGLTLGLPILFGAGPTKNARDGEDPLRTIIFDFQTLIGGALAVAAAWWTVKTMEDTDASAARRHAEQIDLSLRKDRLAVERAVNPQIARLQSLTFYLGSLRAGMLKRNTYRGQIRYIVEHVFALKDCSSSLTKLLELDQFKEGSRLFDGMLAYKLEWLHDRAREIEEIIGPFPNRLFSNQITEVLDDRGTYESLRKVYRAIADLPDEIQIVVELMEATAQQYGVS